MSKPLHFVTKMDLTCRGLDIEANVELDYFRGVSPSIRSRREDCEPGSNAYCTVRGVEVVTQDPSLPRFTRAELFAAAEVAAGQRIDALSQEAEQIGYVEAPAKPTESSLHIYSLPSPQVMEAAPHQELREPVGPAA